MPPARFRLSRRWTIVLISFLCLVLAVLIFIRFFVGPILSHELVSLIEAHLNAKLTLDSVYYRPPYGLALENCKLTFTDPKGAQVDLVQFKELSVSLAELPIHHGPLQLKDLTIKDPVINLVRTADGIEGQTGLVKPDNSPQTSNDQKLSDILRLRHISIERGQVVYLDQTGPVKHPFAWTGIDVHVVTQPQSAADYDFHVDASSGTLSTVSAEGNFNVDELSASVPKFAVTVGLSGGKAPQQLPPEFQAILERYKVKGDLLIAGSTSGSLSQPGQSICQATLSLQDASAYSPEVKGWLEGVQLKLEASGGAKGGLLKLDTFNADSGGVNVSLKEGATISVDPKAVTWSVKNLAGAVTAHAKGDTAARGLLRQLGPDGTIEFSADLTAPLAPSHPWPDSPGQISVTAKDVTLHPLGCTAPVTVSLGPVHLNGKILSVRDLQLHYGSDQFVLTSMRIPIAPLSQRIVSCNELIAALSVHPNGLPYPAPIKDVMAQYRPGGHYSLDVRSFSADFNDPQIKFNYEAYLSGDNGALNVMGIPISQITFDTVIAPRGTQIPKLTCQTLDGTITAAGVNVAMQPPFSYKCDVFIQHANLQKLDTILKLSSGNPVSGFADVTSSFYGSALPVGNQSFVDQLGGQGKFEVSQGNLWTIPALKTIEESASVAKSALTVGQAASYFRIADNVIELQDVAISAPLFGVMGFGTIGFNGDLDIHALPVPLGDWRERLSKTSDFLGDVVGNIQQALNSFTGSIIYEVHVGGTATNPKIIERRGTALNRKQAQTVGNMVKQPDNGKPIDMLNNAPPTTAPAPAK